MRIEDLRLLEEIRESFKSDDKVELNDLEFGWCSNCNDNGGNNGNGPIDTDDPEVEIRD